MPRKPKREPVVLVLDVVSGDWGGIDLAIACQDRSPLEGSEVRSWLRERDEELARSKAEDPSPTGNPSPDKASKPPYQDSLPGTHRLPSVRPSSQPGAQEPKQSPPTPLSSYEDNRSPDSRIESSGRESRARSQSPGLTRRPVASRRPTPSSGAGALITRTMPGDNYE